jgi:hypothetical protein
LSTSPQTYAIAAALLGVFFALQSGMADSIVYDTLIEETGSGADYERRIGRLHAVEAGSLVLSAVVGGVLAALVSARFTYFATIPLVLVSMVALWRCPEPRLHRHAERVRYRQQASQTMRALGANRVVRRAVLLAALVAAASQTLFEFGPLWLVQLHAPDVLYGPYWGAIVSTVGIGAFCASRLPLDRTSALVLIATGLIASTIASAVVANLAVVIVAHVIALLLLAVVGVRAGFLLHEAVAASVRAGVSSGASTLSWAVFLPVSLVFGALARAHGVESAGWLVVGLAGALAVLLVRMPSPDPALDEVAVADLGVAQPVPTPA